MRLLLRLTSRKQAADLRQEASVGVFHVEVYPKGPRPKKGSFKGVIGGYIGIYGDYIRVQGPKFKVLGPKYDIINSIWALKPDYLSPWTLRAR